MTTKQLRREYLPQLRNTSFQNTADDILAQKTALQEIRQKIASGPERIDEKIFNEFSQNKAFGEAMKDAKIGTEMRVKINDGSGEAGGFARYVKQNDGTWKHVESNVSATSMVDDIFRPHLRDKDKKLFLDKDKLLQVEEISLYTSRNARLAELDKAIARADSSLAKTSPDPISPTGKNIFTPAEKQHLIPYDPKFAATLKGLPKQNLADDLNKISSGAGDDLGNGIKAATEGNPTKLQKFFQNHWKGITGGVVGLTILREMFDREKTNPYAILPVELPADPQAAFEQCMKCFRDQESPAPLDYTRPSAANNKVILDEKRREDISRRWMKTAEWQNLMKDWNDVMSNMPATEKANVQILVDKMNAINANPTVALVQELQKCIGMYPDDNANAQDGILGPNTTREISLFIHNCRAQYIQLPPE